MEKNGKKYYLFVKGKKEYVTKEIYLAYVGFSNNTKNEKRRMKRNNVTFYSYEQCKENGNEFIDLLSEFESNIADYSELNTAIKHLSTEEQYLIYEKFYIGLSNREIGEKISLTSQGAGKKIKRCLEKLKLLLNDINH